MIKKYKISLRSGHVIFFNSDDDLIEVFQKHLEETSYDCGMIENFYLASNDLIIRFHEIVAIEWVRGD